MAARSLLLKLEARGLIDLPPRQHPAVNGPRAQRPVAGVHPVAPHQGPLTSLGSLSVSTVAAGSPEAALFGSAAWQCQPRDAFIGWSPEARQRHLPRLTNNTRLLLLPAVQVPHLASHLLGRITRRLSHDWQARYGHPIHLVESFVERDRFGSTSYQAAGWIRVGATTGRGRNGAAPQRPIKEVYLRTLSADFRSRLGA